MTTVKITDWADAQLKRPPDPTPEMVETPEFNAVWNVVKNWEVDWGGGMRSGATGNDVRAILDALAALEAKSVPLKTLAVCSEVDALVKAARAACDIALPDSVGYDLTLALERFETERGE